MKKNKFQLFAGMKVNYHSVVGGPVVSCNHKVISLERTSSGDWVAWISGIGSVVLVSHLSPSE